VLYAVVAFVVAQVAELAMPALLLPDWTFRLVVLLLILGFPVALVLAWSFDVTPDGVRRTAPPTPARGVGPSSRSAGLVGLGMLIALVGFGGYYFMGQPFGHEDAPRAAVGSGHTIAVLPLANMTGGEENEYFADGITEDILTNLGLVPDFTVISRTSVMRYKGTDKSVPEIARELSARYVLEGSLRRSGNQVRVVIQLIEPETDTQIWAQTLDREMEGVFALQSEIAHAVVEALRVELATGVGERIGRAPTEDIEAYELFLHGRDFYYQYSAQAMERAIEMFRQAIERDPVFALAHAWLGAALAVNYFNYTADRGSLPQALEASRTAVRLQPDLADGHRALGTALSVAGRVSEAIASLERAVELNPNDYAAAGNLGLSYALRGDWDDAIVLTQETIARDPVRSFIAYGNLADYYRWVGLLDRGRSAALRALSLRPDDTNAGINLAWVDLLQGRRDDAVRRALEMESRNQEALARASIAGLLFSAGEPATAREILEAVNAEVMDASTLQGSAPPAVLLAYLLQQAGETRRAAALLDRAERSVQEVIAEGSELPELPFSLATIAAIRGRVEEAAGHLERAVELGWTGSTLVPHDPILAPLRDHPRFRAALDRSDARLQAMRERLERET
jgi:TolB-like protein/tetratricopeptide (TPR) repeat protein